ncbi:MAG: diguanylate cyclase, partial [Candidatus Omnitrophica bacterium]|nr:diguanylate cyclase [Candidatus Omnitrophota bacterium]
MKNDYFNFENGDRTIQSLINAVEQTADHVIITDKSGTIQYVNPAFVKTTGFSIEECIGANPRILQSGHHGQEYYQRLWSTILSGKVFKATTTNKKKSGELFYAEQTITPIIDDKGEVVQFVSVWKDVSQRIHDEKELKTLHEAVKFEKYKLEQILSFDEKISEVKQINELIDFIIDKSCEILESQRCSLMLFDRESKQLCIRGSRGLAEKYIKDSRIKEGEGIAGIVLKEKNPILVRDIETDKRFHNYKTREGYKSKSFMSVPILLEEIFIGVVNITDKQSVQGDVYSDLDLKILQAIVRQAAVSIENARMFKELKYLSVTDPMTRLYNFRYFKESLVREIQRIKRYPKPLCLLMIDVDDFKSYNDEFGHPEGDILLKTIGDVLTAELREVDIVCRYAGDEFAVILPETKTDEAELVAQRILDKIDKLQLKKKVS